MRQHKALVPKCQFGRPVDSLNCVVGVLLYHSCNPLHCDTIKTIVLFIYLFCIYLPNVLVHAVDVTMHKKIKC